MAYISTATVNGQVYQMRDSTLAPVVAGSGTPGLMTGADKTKLNSLPNVTISDVYPTSSDGNNGDIWIVYNI